MGPEPSKELEDFRQAIRQAYLENETSAVDRLHQSTGLPAAARRRIEKAAAGLVRALRQAKQPGLMEIFLAEYGLSTQEGVALMCLAEALLRVPDSPTMDALIRDKIAAANWGRHLGHSGSSLVNASTWALMLTGKVIAPGDVNGWDMAGTLRSMIKRIGDPVVRNAVSQAMRILGHQFVLGRDIDEAVKRGRGNEAKGYTHSYDMLGEAAHTADDARRYFLSYSSAITALARHCDGADSRANPGTSVKLSALHPRYEFSQAVSAVPELVARTSALALLAKNANMGFNIDAEEADRLELSLDIIEAVLANADLQGWDGFGVVVQAYSPRASFVIDWLYELARRLDRRIMVRLVKGAYWDSEIKTAQEMGLAGYPVFTRKIATDISYMACARRLLDYADRIYPQFATHNAHSVAAVLQMAGDFDNFEFQRLHGMGENLFELLRQRQGRRCRIYAPVGVHEDLLAYLVRRLLENGANSSFVNQVLDEAVAAEDLVGDPIDAIEALAQVANPNIPLPPALFGPGRRNAKGWNLPDPIARAELQAERGEFQQHYWQAGPLITGQTEAAEAPVAEVQPGEGRAIFNPANNTDLVGDVKETTPAQIEAALAQAVAAAPGWQATDVAERADCLRRIAGLFERHAGELMALAAREAGKTLADCVGELREAVDFCRYYAGEGERLCSADGRRGRGVFLCISPWNFPLAIFTGQIAAALVTGNAVIAKPAEQTPLIAHRAVQLMHQAGIPGEVLQLLPGAGPAVGGALAADPRIAGVCFTGSTDTAQIINRSMATDGNPQAPLIAETGGLNAMIVDSSALGEHAVRDIITAAFQSAGQRCSALRVLFVQADIADMLITLLHGAMAELKLGDPWLLATDVGPVIDSDAKDIIEAHCRKLQQDGRLISRLELPAELAARGHFAAPAAYHLQSIAELEREIFGPVLHVISFAAADLDRVVDAINERGYGLTLGIHTRVDNRVQQICDRARVGNIYVNRNQIGAIVGSQPFGGEGLSGTGPKAGGPFYLTRFTTAATEKAEPTAPFNPPRAAAAAGPDLLQLTAMALTAQTAWAGQNERRVLLEKAAAACTATMAKAVGAALEALNGNFDRVEDLPGPNGESNRLSRHGRGVFYCLGGGKDDGGGGKDDGGGSSDGPARAMIQAVYALALGNGAVVLVGSGQHAEVKQFATALAQAGAPTGLLSVIEADAATAIETTAGLAGVILEQSGDYQRQIRRALAARPGAILPLIDDLADWQPLALERVLSIDTTAAGGNAELLAAAGG